MNTHRLKIIFLILLLSLSVEVRVRKHKKKHKKKAHKSLTHSHRKKRHKKRRLMLPGLGGPKYSDPPSWNLKALNLTTEVPIVTLDKKKQNPLFIVPQIISMT